ncbi:MAG: SAM-dependent DNA methyltransferase [Acidobacteria bacterium]|nr:SAM-dependent DNA methyltransferase [Acidobacteriota bacterium]
MEVSQVRTKERVADHGEVLTGKREVNAMLDLVKQETERIDSRFLEPACGDGNFLTVILERKLAVVEKRYGKSQLDFERYAVLAVSSIYGIDILADNVHECRRRLFEIFDADYTRLFKAAAKEGCREAVRFILERNIIWGDALTLNTVGEKPDHIVFSEWSPVNGSMLKRRDFTFSELLRHEEAMQVPLFPGLENEEQLPLFSDLGEGVFIPTPVREYAPVHFMEIARVGE